LFEEGAGCCVVCAGAGTGEVVCCAPPTILDVTVMYGTGRRLSESESELDFDSDFGSGFDASRATGFACSSFHASAAALASSFFFASDAAFDSASDFGDAAAPRGSFNSETSTGFDSSDGVASLDFESLSNIEPENCCAGGASLRRPCCASADAGADAKSAADRNALMK